MWLDKAGFIKLQYVIESRRNVYDTGKALANRLFFEDQRGEPKPTNCPTCQASLKTTVITYVGVSVEMCPEGHGIWVPHEACQDLAAFIRRKMLTFPPSSRGHSPPGPNPSSFL